MSEEHLHDHHEHDHEHHHDHEHGHSHGPMENKEQLLALLEYTCKHNESHADELDKMAEKLTSFGNEDAAKEVLKAKEFFAKGNASLREALKLM
ncbi:MAG: cobalt transporter [Butyrivibrio sp.]|nr:cobalt transporter [Butyrivibrio sp.]